MNVIKNDGTTQPFDFQKIERMVEGATAFSDNAQHLASSILDDFQILLKNNIRSREIQDQLINTAKNKIDIDNIEMSKVAGKLLMSQIISDVEKDREFAFGDLVELYKYNLANGLYEDNIDLDEYYKILEKVSTYMDRALNYEYEYASVASWKLRYLHKNETPVEVFGLIAGRIALHVPNKSTKEKIKLAKSFLDVLQTQKISLATPFLLNLRMKDGNLSSCFINYIPDDLEKQYDVLKDMAMISKNGGGIGNFFGGIRAENSRIKTIEGIADSVIPYAKLVNDTMNYVNQLGKRKGAATIALPVWHADILNFLNLATEVGDERRKAHDLFLQVVAERHFIDMEDSDGMYHIVCPLEVKEKLGYNLNGGTRYSDIHEELGEALSNGTLKVGRTLRAREIFKAIMASATISGTPYWFNYENVNDVNPAKEIGDIPCGNLCNESYSITNEKYSHTCNLVSLVLPNIKDEELKEVVSIAVDMLDSIVDISVPPTKKAKAHNDAFRVLGIGAMGLADWLAMRNLTYADVNIIGDLFERISLYSLEQSIQRAKEYGKFPMYDKSEWAKGKLYSRDIEWYAVNSRYPDYWLVLHEEQLKYGIRNLQLQAIAPNTSSSVLQGVVASVLPPYSKYHMDSSALGALPIFPRFIKDKFWYYKEYKHMSIIDMNTVIAEIQKWTDSGISYEWVINIDEVTMQDLSDYYVDAYRKGVKGIYYIRWLSNDGNMTDKEECVSCAG